MDHNPIFRPNLLCDFCNNPHVVRSYDAAPIVMKMAEAVLYFCDNRWAACAACASLIEQDRWDELSRRSFDLWIEAEHRHGNRPGLGEQEFMRTHLSRLHGHFREARRRSA